MPFADIKDQFAAIPSPLSEGIGFRSAHYCLVALMVSRGWVPHPPRQDLGRDFSRYLRYLDLESTQPNRYAGRSVSADDGANIIQGM